MIRWLAQFAQKDEEGNRKIVDVPLLVIDDEADNASVDTRQQSFTDGIADADHKPTVINAKIRQIIGSFDQVSYIGYTATPFANIFIHPDAETGKDFQDLFPRDFIVNMPTPDNYVGASRIFGFVRDDVLDVGVGIAVTEHGRPAGPDGHRAPRLTYGL